MVHSMAYCDYLFRRSNGIYYFRYVIKAGLEKRKEIRISLGTRSFVSAKVLAANFISKYKNQLNKGTVINMSAEEDLKILKNNMFNDLKNLPNDQIEYVKDRYDDIERMVIWVKKHIPDKYKDKSVKDVLELYKKYYPYFYDAHTKFLKQKKSEEENEIIELAEKYYGVRNDEIYTEFESDSVRHKFSYIVKNYTNEMLLGDNWKNKTLFENMATFNLFKELQGDLFVNEINNKVFLEFKNKLKKVPKNYQKLSIPDKKPLSEYIKNDSTLPLISVTSINKHIIKISALFRWANKNGYMKDNPAVGQSIKQKKNQQQDRFPFTMDDLSKIFSSKIYTDKKYRHPYYFWLPLLALFTGARINELCQMDIADIKKSKDIYYFDINDDGEKTLKNISSKRLIPIHSKIIDFGFLKFVESEKKRNSIKLFSNLKKERDGHGTAASKWFGRTKSKLNLVDDNKKSFHSFRHNFSDALKNKNVPLFIAQQLTGHSSGTMTYDVYGSEFNLSILKENIEKIEYDVPELKGIKY